MSKYNNKTRVGSVMAAMRETSASSLLMRQKFARNASMNGSDAECVDFLRHNGPVLSSDVARRFGLTKGAVTSMVRRLEQPGIITTQIDINDRRKLWISVDTDKLTEITNSYKKLADETASILENYNEDELMLIEKFNIEMNTLYSKLQK